MLNITADQYSYVSTVYTACFMLAEIPSNLTIKWATPRVSNVHDSREMWLTSCSSISRVSSFFGVYAAVVMLLLQISRVFTFVVLSSVSLKAACGLEFYISEFERGMLR